MSKKRSAVRRTGAVTLGLVGWLFLVEIVSGILQGYYVPLIPDLVEHLGIRDADFNWFEAAQLLLSAIVVPVLAKLGDMYGHKRTLLVSTALTAGASWWLAVAGDFPTFLLAWALQGFYVVWLPLEVALIFDRARRTRTGPSDTRRAAGYLVVALEIGAILGALGGARVFAALGEHVPGTLAVPAVAVTLVFFAILFGVPESTPAPGRSLDTLGFVLLTGALLTLTSGLTFLRINGPEAWWVYVLMAAGLLLFLPFGRHELRHRDPANGFGLGLSSTEISYIIGGYLVSMIVGALLFPLLSRWSTPRLALIVAAFFVAAGYLAFLPLHDTVPQVTLNMVIAGIGSGALVGAMPAAAAAAAPRGQTGVATALTNTTKTIGGSLASAVFAVVLVSLAAEAVTATAASLAGYLVVFAICGGGALVAAALLFFVPRLAFADPTEEEFDETRAATVPVPD